MKKEKSKQKQKINPAIILFAIFGIVLIFFLNRWKTGNRDIPREENIFQIQEIQELREIIPEEEKIEQLKKLREIRSIEDLKKLEQFQGIFGEIIPDEITFKKFITPDKNIQIKYPDHWFKAEGEILKDLFPIPRHIKEKYDFTTLLVVKDIDIYGVLTLMINRLTADTPLGFDDVIRVIKDINTPQGVEINILSSEIKENKAIFEAIYKRDNERLRSKEKILFLEQEQKVFLVTFLAPEKMWKDTQELRNKIINSAQIIQ